MKARRLVTMVSLLLLAACGAAGAASVAWTDGTTPPAAWTITPSKPATSDTIAFAGPTRVYSNACVGENELGGTPMITVDAVSRTILLWFQGPVSGVCTKIYLPVCGLQGEFGPLEAGDWTFTSLSRDLNFEVRFTVGGTKMYHVDADAPGPAHDGVTWATAFVNLQDAIAAAGPGDTILVAEGTYKPDQGGEVVVGDRAASFVLKDGVVFKGGFAGYGQPNPDARDIAGHETVLSGDLKSDDLWGTVNRGENSYHVLTGPSGTEPARLDGFSVVRGNANGRFPNDLGGGLYSDAALTVVNCTFEGNTAAFGGGILSLNAELTLVNTQLIGNRAFVSGGGLYNWEGTAILHNCRVVGNSADRASATGGAAIDNLTARLTVINSTIADNLSPNGGAINCFTWDSEAGRTITITNSIVYNGGREISTNNADAVSVAYSDVQGGAMGTGNISAAPLFVAPGARSIEGAWVDGDYRLQATSPCLNTGGDAQVPADVADLDGDGDVAETLPQDLDGAGRIQGTHVDMGAYEQRVSTPTTKATLTFLYGGKQHTLTVDPVYSDTFSGNVTVQAESNFKLQLIVDVTATSAAGGTWTGWTVPATITPPGEAITIYVKGVNLNVAALPTTGSVQVAEVELSGRLVP